MKPALKMETVSNIARRHHFLFTLPSTTKAVALEIITLAWLYISLRYGLDAPLFTDVYNPLVFSATATVLVLSEFFFMRRNNLARPRRLLTASAVSNMAWLTTAAVGWVSASFAGASSRLASTLVLGMFFTIALRLFIYGSVFTSTPFHAIPVSSVPPTLLLLAASPNDALPQRLSTNYAPLFGGLTTVALVLAYLLVIDITGRRFLSEGPLRLLRAFLNSWAEHQPSDLESLIEIGSSPSTIKTSMVEFSSLQRRILLIVPEVHPGPFYPVGSSNLPFLIYERLKDQHTLPLIFHGVSGHDHNLPTLRDVEGYLSSLQYAQQVDAGDSAGGPITIRVDTATVTGIVFSKTAFLMLTLAPYGMEDFPPSLREEIESSAYKLGFKHCVVVDCHNSLGYTVRPEDYSALLTASRQVLEKLLVQPQGRLRIGGAHSHEFGFAAGGDTGPAGISCVTFDFGDSAPTIVVVDANNAAIGLRDQLRDTFKASQSPIIELCTSDTHATSRKMLSEKGYEALGEHTPFEGLKSICDRLNMLSRDRLNPTTFTVKTVKSEVNVTGAAQLTTLSLALDRTSHVAKNMGMAIIAFAAIVLLVSVAL